MNNQPLDSGTDIYIKNTETNEDDTLNRNFNDFKKVDSVDFINNRCLIFHPGDNTWHGLDKNKSHTDRRLIQINWISDEYSSFPTSIPLQD